MNSQNAARVSGAMIVAAAAAIIIGVFARVAADADQDTLRQSLQAIAQNRAAYSAYGALTLLSGAAMIGRGLVHRLRERVPTADAAPRRSDHIRNRGRDIHSVRRLCHNLGDPRPGHVAG